MKISALFKTRLELQFLPLAALLLLPLSGCSSSADSSSDPAQTLDNLSWRLVELHNQPPSGTDASSTPTLLFDTTAKRVSGFSGVNRFSGPYTLTGTQLSFGSLISTRMAGPPDAMNLESDYLKALASVTEWSVVEGQLVVLNTDKAIVLRFEKL